MIEQAAAAREKLDDIARRRTVNIAAANAIVAAISDIHSGSAEEGEKIAKRVVAAVFLNQVPGVRITY